MGIDDVNQITIDAYDRAPQLYEERTPRVASGVFKDWIDFALAQIPIGVSILEIGSGTGRDAHYMEQAGYRVRRTEASDGLRDRLLSMGLEVEKLNLLLDEIPRQDHMIFANAVLHHFNQRQIGVVLQKILDALPLGGFLVFSVKEGDGEEWETEKLIEPRYFLYWRKEDLADVLTTAGFEIIQLIETARERSGKKWLQAVVRKSERIHRISMPK